MTLAEIFVQLPPSVATYLEELLEQAPIPENPTREQVLAVADQIAIELRFSAVDCTLTGDEELLELINQIPQAIVAQLF